MRKIVYLIPVAVIALAVALSSLFIVDPRQKALVMQFGRVNQVIEQPGLYFKVPLLEQVVYYDGRILGLPTPPLEVTPLDDRRIVVDAFARWRISDLVQFRKATGTQGINFAQQRLEHILSANIREVLGSVPSSAVLSKDRTPLMVSIRNLARKEADALGIDVIDVRLTRTDLPEQSLSATYARMQAEFQRQSALEIANGKKEAQTIRATADRTALELTSEAQEKADVIRGQADAKSNAIYAEAFNKDPELFSFLRSLSSYQKALQGSNTTMVLSPDGQFFRYLHSDSAGKDALAPVPSAAPSAAAGPFKAGAAPAGAAPARAEAGTPPAPVEKRATAGAPTTPAKDAADAGEPSAPAKDAAPAGAPSSLAGDGAAASGSK